MSMYRVLYRVHLHEAHISTRNTRHFRNGQLLFPPTELQIVRIPGDAGYYLIHFDANGEELTDTLHESVADAMEQTQFEFKIRDEDWEIA